MIDKNELKAFTVINYLNPNNFANIVPFTSDVNISLQDIKRITLLCNQERIYEILFKDKFNGRQYTESDATSFKEWANRGWTDSLYFVFLITSFDKIIGAVDIKSNNEELAEIGYWIDEASTGFMTNVVKGLIKQARLAGYKSLYAHTKIENDKSAGVLKRTGFKLAGQVEKEPGIIRNKYILTFTRLDEKY